MTTAATVKRGPGRPRKNGPSSPHLRFALASPPIDATAPAPKKVIAKVDGQMAEPVKAKPLRMEPVEIPRNLSIREVDMVMDIAHSMWAVADMLQAMVPAAYLLGATKDDTDELSGAVGDGLAAASGLLRSQSNRLHNLMHPNEEN